MLEWFCDIPQWKRVLVGLAVIGFGLFCTGRLYRFGALGFGVLLLLTSLPGGRGMSRY